MKAKRVGEKPLTEAGFEVFQLDEESYYLGWCDPRDSESDGDFQLCNTRFISAVDSDKEQRFAEVHNFIVERIHTMCAPHRVGTQLNHELLIWETESSANIARTAVQILKNRFLDDIPWPAWALKARTAGWTPPEGWSP